MSLIEKVENNGCIFFLPQNISKMEYVTMAYSGLKINFPAICIIASWNVTKKRLTASLIGHRILVRELDALPCFLYNPLNLNKTLDFL